MKEAALNEQLLELKAPWAVKKLACPCPMSVQQHPRRGGNSVTQLLKANSADSNSLAWLGNDFFPEWQAQFEYGLKPKWIRQSTF